MKGLFKKSIFDDLEYSSSREDMDEMIRGLDRALEMAQDYQELKEYYEEILVIIEDVKKLIDEVDEYETENGEEYLWDGDLPAGSMYRPY